MPTPLLSFLNDIEDALRKESATPSEAPWEISRVVNYHHGLGRMTLTPTALADTTCRRGAIFLQSVPLANGYLCFKASLNWHGSDAFPMITVHSKPRVNWKDEAKRIATAWLAGPPTAFVATATRDSSPMVATAS